MQYPNGNFMKLYDIYFYDTALREAFKRGELVEQWSTQYPMLFGAAEMALAVNQPSNHFFEWLGAIQIYKDLNYLCLIEKYQFKKHVSKYEIFRNIVPDEVFALVDRKNSGGRQFPDLFAYSPDKTDWFFCEVKGNKDRFSPGQAAFFDKLQIISNKQIQWIKFRPKKLTRALPTT